MAVWRTPGLLDRSCVLPFGPAPASTVANLSLLELVVHGWDIAQATGDVTAIPPVLVEPGFDFARRFADGLRGAAFAGAVPVDGAPQDRLIAFLWRTP